MEEKTKVGVCFVSVLLASAIYGHHRFASSRYPPKYDVLPDISLYDGKTRNYLTFRATSNPDGTIKKSVSLDSSDEDNIIPAIYTSGKLIDVLDFPIANGKPVQIVRLPLNIFILKGIPSYDPVKNVVKSYLGFKEIFFVPAAAEFSCELSEKIGMPKACTEPKEQKQTKKQKKKNKPSKPVVNSITIKIKAACELIKQMGVLLQSASPSDKCKLIELKAELAKNTDFSDIHNVYTKEKQLEVAIFNSQILIEDTKLSQSLVRSDENKFWKGWDWIFGFGSLFYCGIVLAGNKILSASIAALLVLRSKIKEVKIRMKENKENQREELKKKYLEGVDKLYKRLQNAKNLEDCRLIRDNFRELEDELINNDNDLFAQLIDTRRRFLIALDSRIEYLGGPKAMFHIYPSSTYIKKSSSKEED